jgi:hypothetical protein
MKYNSDSSSSKGSSSKGPIIITDTNENTYINPEGEIFATVGTGGISSHSFSRQAPYIVNQQSGDFGFLNIGIKNNDEGDILSAKFYANHRDAKVKDEFTIVKPNSSK